MIYKNPSNPQTYASNPTSIQYAQQPLISSAIPQNHLAQQTPISPAYEGRILNYRNMYKSIWNIILN